MRMECTMMRRNFPILRFLTQTTTGARRHLHLSLLLQRTTKAVITTDTVRVDVYALVSISQSACFSSESQSYSGVSRLDPARTLMETLLNRTSAAKQDIAQVSWSVRMTILVRLRRGLRHGGRQSCGSSSRRSQRSFLLIRAHNYSRLGVWAYTYTCTYIRVHTRCTRVFWRLTPCIARAICLVNSVMSLSFGWLVHIVNYYEQNIYLQRHSSHFFFERYTRLYHEPWHSVSIKSFTKWQALQLIYAGRRLLPTNSMVKPT